MCENRLFVHVCPRLARDLSSSVSFWIDIHRVVDLHCALDVTRAPSVRATHGCQLEGKNELQVICYAICYVGSQALRSTIAEEVLLQ